jgi:hypothetical protein
MHTQDLIKYTHGYEQWMTWVCIYEYDSGYMQMELQKPVTNSTEFEKWAESQIWIVANWGIIHVDNWTTYIYPTNTGNNTALTIL